MIAWLKDLIASNVVAKSSTRTAAKPPPVSARAERGETLAKQLALVIDLNVCVGCHACVTSCKEWNTSGSAGPLADEHAYAANPTGTFFNRVRISAYRGRSFQAIVDGVSEERGRHFRLIVDDVSA